MKIRYSVVLMLLLIVIFSVMVLASERMSRVTSGQLTSAIAERSYTRISTYSPYIKYVLSYEVDGKKYEAGGFFQPNNGPNKNGPWTEEHKNKADAWLRSHPVGSTWQVTYHTIWPWLNYSELEPLETWKGKARLALFIICGVMLIGLLALFILMSRLIGIAKRYQSK